ncbi:MAG: hypothetical protein H7Z37_13080 [Pyrinomonadaceae bacterium]|nr:hypothetical protein [Pyrinomonadaceae bacterium]
MSKFTSPLSNLKIASPCSANWDEMAGDNRKRFCGDCKLNVYNLSGMSKDEAESLLQNAEGRLCVRFYSRPDGSVLTEDCPVGWQALKRLLSSIATVTATFVIGVFSVLGTQSATKPLEGDSLSTLTIATLPKSLAGKFLVKPTPTNPSSMGGVIPEFVRQIPQSSVGRVNPKLKK